MFLKVVFDKTAFVKFKIGNNFKQNIDETHSKQPKIHRKIHTSLWIFTNLKKKICEPKASRLLPNLCDFQEKSYPRLWLQKSIENLKPSLWIFILCDFLYVSTKGNRLENVRTFRTYL
jgi:hypothetical protein